MADKIYFKTNYQLAPLAQLYRALVFGTKGWGLESLVEHHKTPD